MKNFKKNIIKSVQDDDSIKIDLPKINLGYYRFTLVDKKNVYSKEDLSKQREDVSYLQLFTKNGFYIFRHFPNPNWPQGLMPLIVYVLKKKK